MNIPKIDMGASYWTNLWLNCMGGRNIRDVKKDKDGEYVLMNTRRGDEVKVYIPSEELIKRQVNGHK